MRKAKPVRTTETKLKRIASLSGKDSKMEWNWLMPHFNEESLKGCFKQLDGKKELGADGMTKEDHGKLLDGNVKALISKMKTMSYRPSPVREVLIPKDDGRGGTRPLVL